MKLDGKTNEELVELRRSIESDPANKGDRARDGLNLFTKAARKKLDEIDRQITHNLAEKRAAEGRPVPVDGYSGRNSKKRKR